MFRVLNLESGVLVYISLTSNSNSDPHSCQEFTVSAESAGVDGVVVMSRNVEIQH